MPVRVPSRFPLVARQEQLGLASIAVHRWYRSILCHQLNEGKHYGESYCTSKCGEKDCGGYKIGNQVMFKSDQSCENCGRHADLQDAGAAFDAGQPE